MLVKTLPGHDQARTKGQFDGDLVDLPVFPVHLEQEVHHSSLDMFYQVNGNSKKTMN